jgi:hypothetical protein
VQKAMLEKDHGYTAENLEVKARLKSLLHLETFDCPPAEDPIFLTAVGRGGQKNLPRGHDIVGCL